MCKEPSINPDELITKKEEHAASNGQFANHNPNQNHNTKKESLGPNTRR